MITLKTKDLTVLVAEPAEVTRQTVRFDHTGFVTDIILKGSARFCASEPRSIRVPSTGGRGLCSAYRFDAFDEAAIGGWAPRWGVGLLQKLDDQGFRNGREYPCIPFQHQVEQISNTKLRFCTLPMPCMGYSAETRRTLTLEGTSLCMEMEFYNVGERPITFREFCHNFLTMDGLSLTSDYMLEMPQVTNWRKNLKAGVFAEDFYHVSGSGIRPKGRPKGFAVFEIGLEDILDGDSFEWTLRHDDAQISVVGTEYYHPREICVWAKDHMLCPEVNFTASVQPGQKAVWKRKWIFSAE